MRVPSVPNDVRCNPADNCERGAKKQFNNRNKKNDDATRRDARNVDAVRYPTDIYDRGAAHLRVQHFQPPYFLFYFVAIRPKNFYVIIRQLIRFISSGFLFFLPPPHFSLRIRSLVVYLGIVLKRTRLVKRIQKRTKTVEKSTEIVYAYLIFDLRTGTEWRI